MMFNLDNKLINSLKNDNSRTDKLLEEVLLFNLDQRYCFKI